MGSFSIHFKPSVEKDLRRLPRAVIQRVMARLERLSSEPFAKQAVKLSGAEQLYRPRVSDYRIVYGVDTEAQQIVVHYIRHRRIVYRAL